MRIRIAATALAGAVALGAFAPTLAFADTTTTAPAPVVTKASVNSVTIGLSGTFTVAVSISAKGTDIQSIKAEPYPLSHPDEAWTAADLAADDAMPVKAASATAFTVAQKIGFPWAKAQHFSNAAAGAYGVSVLVTDKAGHQTYVKKATTYSWKRADAVSGKVVSTHVAKGHNVTLNGKLSRANWDKWIWQGHTSQKVALQYRKPGTSTWVTKKWVTSNSKGYVSASVRDWATGYWRFVYSGNSVSGAAHSVGVKVYVK